MKKFVTLIVVLGMVSVANAAPVLTMNGAPAPSSITLMVLDTIELDIEIDPGLIGGEFTISLNNAQASLDYSGIWLNPNYSLMGVMDMPWDFPWGFTAGKPLDAQNVTIDGGNMSAYNGDFRTLMNGLILTCDDDTPVIVQLIASGLLDYDEGAGYTDIPQGTLLGQISIDQWVPEPATIVLLGLGGLLLRRRK